MLFNKLLPLLTTVSLMVFGACGAEMDPSEDDVATASGALTTADQSVEFGCSTCWVRCTDAEPEQCKWTKANDIGPRADCSKAGRTWCANHKYTYSYAGCRKATTEHKDCSCDPDGHCGKK